MTTYDTSKVTGMHSRASTAYPSTNFTLTHVSEAAAALASVVSVKLVSLSPSKRLSAARLVGMHALSHGCLGKGLSLHLFFHLKRQYLFDGSSSGNFKDALFFQEVIEVAFSRHDA